MKKHHKVESVHVEKGIISMIVDGKKIQRELKEMSPLLAGETEEQQKEFEVSPSGYGIHWQLIDEDISIDGLLGVEHKPDISKKSA